MYTLDFSLALGPGKTGLTDLRAQLTDTSGANVGSAVTTGFVEIGTSGNYLWHYAAFPDAHRGGVKFYSNAAPTVFLLFAAVNPEEAENTDIKSSAISAALTIVDDFLDTEILAIKAKTDNLPTDPADASDISAAISALNNITVADILAATIEGSLDLKETLRLALAVLVGKSSGGGTTSVAFRDTQDTKDRVQATVNSNGNRTVITLDVTD